MKRIQTLFAVIILLHSIIGFGQTKNKAYNPCNDSLYIYLKAIKMDSLSSRQFEYFISKEKECAEYNKTLLETKPTQKIADQYSTNSDILIILLVISVIGGVAFLIANNANSR